MTSLAVIRGITEDHLAALRDKGVNSPEKLLDAAATKQGRKDLSHKTGIPESLILRWANQADLNRVRGIGGGYAELLEEAGIDTVPELAKRKAENLYRKLHEINARKPVVRWLPTEKLVQDWVAQAGSLPRKLEY